jgi:hypothetical protein
VKQPPCRRVDPNFPAKFGSPSEDRAGEAPRRVGKKSRVSRHGVRGCTRDRASTALVRDPHAQELGACPSKEVRSERLTECTEAMRASECSMHLSQVCPYSSLCAP